MRSKPLFRAGLVLLVLVFSASPVYAQDMSVSPAMGRQGSAMDMSKKDMVPADEVIESVSLLDNLDKSTWLRPISMEKGVMQLVEGRSHIMRLSRKIKRISVSDPEILDVVILSPTEVLLNARAQGAINVIFWDDRDRVSVFDISVTRDIVLLQDLLRRVSPNSEFEVYPTDDVFVVRGEVENATLVEEIGNAINAFAEGSVNLVRVKNPKQIKLETRFVQLDHSQNFDFGVDWETIVPRDNRVFVSNFLPGGTNANFENDIAPEVSNLTIPESGRTAEIDILQRSASDVFQFLVFNSDASQLTAFVKAIETKGLGKTIAHPTLIAKDGEEASFLVGGEAAVVAVSNNNVNVDYREFGTRLTFTPHILENGKIRVDVDPEVSNLDFTNGVTVNNIVVPSFTVTRISTSVDLFPGDTFLLSGLLQQKVITSDAGVPGLRRLPIIGKLFQNMDHNYTDTELLIIVTPTLVDAESGAPQDGMISNDALGRATQMLPMRIQDDDHMLAMQHYLKTGDRNFKGKGILSKEAKQKLKALEERNEARRAEVVEITSHSAKKQQAVSKPQVVRSAKPAVMQTAKAGTSKPVAKQAKTVEVKSANGGGGVDLNTLDKLEEELAWN